MGVLNGLKTMVGIPDGLGGPPPHYLAVAEGLIVSTDRAEAWFTIAPASSQTLTDAERDDQTMQVINAMVKALHGYHCHLKVMWGSLDSGDYFTEVEGGEVWNETRADNIDSWGLAERHVMIGVQLEDRTSAAYIQALRRTVEWVHDDDRGIPRRELAALTRSMRSLAGVLQDTPWKVAPAPVEKLAWMIARENYRRLSSPPTREVVTSAAVARLSAGKMIPWPDHVRLYGPDGTTSAYVTYLALTEFPEELEVPGNGEWLLTLSGIDRLTIDGEEGDRIDVHAEANVYFDLMSRAQSQKAVKKVKESAKEQQRAAAGGVAGQASLDVLLSGAEADQLDAELRRGRTSLVRCWPTLSVAEPNLAALEASVDAVIQHYADLGITAEVLVDQQKEAWLQSHACDTARIDDLSQMMDTPGFFGSWFWGGSVVGEDTGPAIGYTTGATRHIVRFWPSEAPRRGDTSTVAIVGRSGRGKTTLMQLLALDEANNDAWVTVFDFKGDLDNQYGGICAAADHYGIRQTSADVGRAFAGAADLLALSKPDVALSQSHAQLMLLISDALRPAAQAVLSAEISALLESGEERTTAHLIDRMNASDKAVANDIAAELHVFASDRYGMAIVGRMDGLSPLDLDPGLHLIRFPGLTPPRADVDPANWDTSERLQAAVMRGLLAWVTQTAGTDHLRSMRKVICVPESHLLTASTDGAAFLSQTARMARALGETLIIDTQDTASLAEHDGIMEQIVTVFAFSQNTPRQQDALAELLGLDPTSRTRSLIKDVSIGPSGGVWHGHCYMRDYKNRVASVQITYPSEVVARLLDTNPASATTVGSDHED